MDKIELIEETDLAVPKNQLGEELAAAFYGDPRFQLDSPPGKDNPYRLRSKGWVGQIPIGNMLVVVQPKVPIASIFGMLEVAYQLKSFKIFDGETAVQSLEEIYERIASILAKRVSDRFRKGLYRSYVERDDDLEFVRGRIDIRGNMRNAVVGAPRLRCHFEELTADLEENSILLWALYSASRLGLQRDEVKRQVRRAFRSLIGNVSLEPKSARDCVGRFYHRLNDDYQPMHGLARFLIEHAGPTTHAGKHEFLPFAVKMPTLFEAFVAEWLKQNLPDELKVDPKYHARLDANADLSFEIDLVLHDRESGAAIAVLDTKYKLAGLPSAADLQQVVSYAVELGVTRAWLVYPFGISRPIRVRVGNVDVETVGIDLDRPIEESGRDFIETICAQVMRSKPPPPSLSTAE